MLADESKLRWAGIDMRPRGRRRVAVVVTYFVLFGSGVAVAAEFTDRPYCAALCWIVAACVVLGLSVLRPDGVVKSFDDKPVLRLSSGGERVVICGLDEWAQYRYGVACFEAASEEQQSQLLSSYKYGPYLVLKKPGDNADAPWLDERELKERSRAERWSLKTIAALLIYCSTLFVTRAHHHEKVDPLEAAFNIGCFALLALTLPKARVLWTEPDPRDVMRELTLVHGTNEA